jgi:hypothetical protein
VRDLSFPFDIFLFFFFLLPVAFFTLDGLIVRFPLGFTFSSSFYFFPVDERGTLATAVAAVASLPHPPLEQKISPFTLL